MSSSTEHTVARDSSKEQSYRDRGNKDGVALLTWFGKLLLQLGVELPLPRYGYEGRLRRQRRVGRRRRHDAHLRCSLAGYERTNPLGSEGWRDENEMEQCRRQREGKLGKDREIPSELGKGAAMREREASR